MEVLFTKEGFFRATNFDKPEKYMFSYAQLIFCLLKGLLRTFVDPLHGKKDELYAFPSPIIVLQETYYSKD